MVGVSNDRNHDDLYVEPLGTRTLRLTKNYVAELHAWKDPDTSTTAPVRDQDPAIPFHLNLSV